MPRLIFHLGVVGHDVRGDTALSDHVVDARLLRHVLPHHVDHVVHRLDRVERPLSGAAAACAAMPRNLKLAVIVASDVTAGTELVSPGCQARTASTSFSNPARTMYTLPPPPSSAGVP